MKYNVEKHSITTMISVESAYAASSNDQYKLIVLAISNVRWLMRQNATFLHSPLTPSLGWTFRISGLILKL